MNSFVIPLLMGMPQGGGEGGGMGMLGSFLPFVLIIGIFYFLIIRPQRKKQTDTQKMLSALRKGDKVVTIGGMHGTIQKVKETTVIVKVDDNVKLEFSRSAIQTVLTRVDDDDDDDDKDDKKTEEKTEKEESSDSENTKE
jgi:preprotein translocase subunit YajC